MCSLRELPKPGAQLLCRVYLSASQIKDKESCYRRKKLWRFSDVLAQLEGPAVGLFYDRGSIAPGRYQWRAYGETQRQFLLGTLGGIGQGGKEIEPLCEVAK